MSALKCPQCGLTNFATATQCKRCQTLFTQNLSSTPGSTLQGIVLEDGYVLPPPPSVGLPNSGVWRDRSTLVMSKDAQLPDPCVKCNAFTVGRLRRKFAWHHPPFISQMSKPSSLSGYRPAKSCTTFLVASRVEFLRDALAENNLELLILSLRDSCPKSVDLFPIRPSSQRSQTSSDGAGSKRTCTQTRDGG